LSNAAVATSSSFFDEALDQLDPSSEWDSLLASFSRANNPLSSATQSGRFAARKLITRNGV